MLGNGLRYILDASVFIEAHRRYYTLDLCPGFWDSIDYYGAQGTLASIDRVRDEIKEGDRLDQWKSKTPAHFFLSTDTRDVVTAYREVIKWAQGENRLLDAAKTVFAGDTDAWLVAYTKARSLTMVTEEVPAPNSKASVKIPDACRAFHIPFMNTFDMLRTLQVSYHWHQPSGAS
jgi:hypothetical protein